MYRINTAILGLENLIFISSYLSLQSIICVAYFQKMDVFNLQTITNIKKAKPRTAGINS